MLSQVNNLTCIKKSLHCEIEKEKLHLLWKYFEVKDVELLDLMMVMGACDNRP